MHSIKDTVKQLIGKSLDAYNKKYTSPINNRIDNIVAQAGTDNTEIVDARIDSAGVSHTTLNNRILAETKMTDEKLMEYSGSSLSVEDTMPGYLQNIEIKGNTIQNEDNLEDIRSVGDKIEGQELYEIPVLSRGKNLFNSKDADVVLGKLLMDTGKFNTSDGMGVTGYIPVKAGQTLVCSGGVDAWYGGFYDTNKVWKKAIQTLKVIFDEDGYYRVSFRINDISTAQIEFGNTATSYEPYQEDKITILSPTPLEKVGDVADRIIEKDGVWGVEKNVVDMLLNEANCTISMRNSSEVHPNYVLFDFSVADTKSYVKTGALFCDKINYLPYSADRDACDKEGCWLGSAIFFTVKILKSKLESVNVDGMKKWLKTNNLNLKYQTTNPTFIPLPHDQQIKLRTFANKTNISFLTEVEGTIKAQVPKSLGATVNTHTEQISNLNKELDRVKKLEESTVSTVETESDFTTVEATSNGYFEDVKLEGKTLVNLSLVKDYNSSLGSRISVLSEKREFNSVFTVFVNIVEDNTVNGVRFEFTDINGNYTYKNLPPKTIGRQVFKINHSLPINRIRIYIESNDYSNKLHSSVKDIIILEGDHTQNPPNGYIEGLKSVGQSASEDGADEIVVLSAKGDGNLVEYIELNGVNSGDGGDFKNSKYVRTNYITVEPNQTYYIKLPTNVLYINCVVYSYNSNKSYLGYKSGLTSEFTTVANTKFIRIDMKKADNTDITQEDINNCDFVVSKCRVSEYIPHQADKKRLLYYNNETQAWEKPILREWDSIEKHSDGKYYYHQRSGEVVLNGSEEWKLGGSSTDTTLLLYVKPSEVPKSYALGICDKFKFQTTNNESIRNTEYIFVYTDINIRINKSRLSTQNVAGFKQWLQSNNVTVVYQLAEEKVYECTNIDLITYNGETNYIVESGVLSPKTTLKVHNNISNVVSLLQKKVSLLESNITSYMITQNRMQLASTYSADSVTFKVDYALCSEEVEYNEDLYNLILNNILVGKDNYDYNKMFNIILDYASWNQISWEQFDILVGVMDSQHNPPIEEEIPVE